MGTGACRRCRARSGGAAVTSRPSTRTVPDRQRAEARDRPQQRGLADAGRSEQRHALASRHLESHVFEAGLVAERHVRVDELETVPNRHSDAPVRLAPTVSRPIANIGGTLSISAANAAT